MKHQQNMSVVAALVFIILAGSSVLALQKVQAARGKLAPVEEILYLPSGKTLKKLSLGYSSLLADIYWTRAVQYFGVRHVADTNRYDLRYPRQFGARHIANSNRYDLLYPLLDITTDLDPQLIEAYETGSIFLSQPIPEGASEPDKAVALLEKGIRANPAYWRMYFTLGFVHHLDRKDFKSAQQAFEKGSQVPGALSWMKVMAARMAEKGEDTTTALTLWSEVYDTNQDKMVRDSALKHIASLRADLDIQELQRRLQTYKEKTGSPARNWSDLVRAGLLPGIPLDPSGSAYVLMANGAVWVADTKTMPYVGQSLQGNAH